MNVKKQKFFFIITVFLLLILVLHTLRTSETNFSENTRRQEFKECENQSILKNSAKVPISPIIVDNEGGGMYTWEQAESLFWCSGQGTQSSPYVIQDIIINGGMDSGIEIRNSNAYFKIINCEIYNMGDDFEDAGIKLNNTQNGQIIDSIISNNNFYGILLDNSHHNRVEDNTLESNNMEGLILVESNYNTLSGNTFRDNSVGGLYISRSVHNKITGNLFDANLDNGIHLDSSHYNTITGNTIKNQSNIGILLEISNYNTELGNNFVNNGKDIEEIDSSGYIFEEENGDDDDDDDDTKEEAILGFNLYILVSMIGIISVLLIKRRCKLINQIKRY